jgi:hypothetical protein
MRGGNRRWLKGALLVTVLSVTPGTAAWAGSCGALRSFSGLVTAASGGSLAVERGGRSRSFQKASDVRVVDEAAAGVSKWGELRPGLRVVVCWAFDDDPIAARQVFVTGR